MPRSQDGPSAIYHIPMTPRRQNYNQPNPLMLAFWRNGILNAVFNMTATLHTKLPQHRTGCKMMQIAHAGDDHILFDIHNVQMERFRVLQGS